MFGRFVRNRSGATAIEFVILAPMFLATIFSTFEVGWLITKSTLLDRALDTTVRQLRTGGASAPNSQTTIRDRICSLMYVVPNCSSALTIEMTKISSASDFPSTSATCVDRGSAVAPVVSFTMGARSEIVYIRACLVTDTLTPYLGIGLNFQKDSQGGYRIVSSSAFINEPGD